MTDESSSFCYIFGEYKTVDNRKSITDFVRQAYYAYFWIKLEDQDKPWAPHIVTRHVENVWDNGQVEPVIQWDLVYQYFGERLQIMLTTATSVL